MSDIAIRVAEPAECPALEALQWRAPLANDRNREALLAHPDAIALPFEQIAAGCVFVEPHLWKRGIGRLLVEHIAEVARLAEASVLHVVGNPHAKGFYTSCGFREVGTVATRFGVGLNMRRPL